MDEVVKSKTSISRGLDAIFTAHAHSENISSEQNQTIDHKILISKIKFSPFQPRKNFNDHALLELSESIKLYGILQPLIVRPLNADYVELLAGERRLRAAMQLGLTSVPAVICRVDNQTAMAFGLIENIQRENLNAIEESDAYLKLLNEYQLTHDELANRVGKSRSHITNMMRLNRLDDFVKSLLASNKISMGHARALLSLEQLKQVEIAHLILAQDLSVRATEYSIKKLCNQKDNLAVLDPTLQINIMTWQACLKQKFLVKTDISFNQAGRGKLTLRVDSPAEMAQLIEKLT